MHRGYAFGSVFVLGVGFVGAAACTASSDVGGGADAGADSASSPSVDSGTPGADATGGATDAADAGDASACTQHLTAGFTQVVASSTVADTVTGNSTERGLAMALDENDDPMFAYFDAGDGTHESLWFVRWDACAGAFTAPVKVDDDHAFGGSMNVSMAYDPSTKEIGIVYVKGDTENNWANGFSDMYLATSKAPSSGFTLQELTHGSTDFVSSGSPSIAMSGGHVYIAYWQGPYDGPSGFPYYVWLLSSASTPQPPPPVPGMDGGAPDAGDAGPPPPHYFSYVTVPFNGDDASPPDNHKLTGWADPRTDNGGISVAVDANGAPGVAFYESPYNYNTSLLFWRPGMAEATVAATSNGTQNDEVDVTLRFEGTKPRVAGHLVADTTGSYELTFVASDDGTTWGTPVRLPAGGTAFDSRMAFDGAGHFAIGSDRNTTNPSCPANPFFATSSDDGAHWTVACPDTNDTYGYDAYSIEAAYGTSRLKGIPVLAFQNTSGDTDAAADQKGIVYWQHP